MKNIEQLITLHSVALSYSYERLLFSEDSAQAHMPSIVENNAEIQIVGEVLHTAVRKEAFYGILFSL